MVSLIDCMMDISLCEIEVSLMAKVDCIWSSYLCTECLYDLKLKLLRFVDELKSFTIMIGV